jgi:hypothetical protein
VREANYNFILVDVRMPGFDADIPKLIDIKRWIAMIIDLTRKKS